MMPLLPLSLRYIANAPIPIERYGGSMWRSGFGANLRELACVTGAPQCTDCTVRPHCAYGSVFDTIRPATAQGLNARHHEQPHPYLLSPRDNTETTATVDFTITAPALPYLPLLLRALKRLRPSRKLPGEWQLAGISARGDTSTDDREVWTAGQQWPALNLTQLQCPPVPKTVRITLEHPLRLRVRGEYLVPESFTGSAFVAALLRRIDMLGGLAATDDRNGRDIAGLLAISRTFETVDSHLQWQDWSRYSSRQHQTIPMGGVIGSFELRGTLEPIWPHLWIGQWLHVGKGAVMGLGRYRVDPLP